MFSNLTDTFLFINWENSHDKSVNKPERAVYRNKYMCI